MTTRLISQEFTADGTEYVRIIQADDLAFIDPRFYVFTVQCGTRFSEAHIWEVEHFATEKQAARWAKRYLARTNRDAAVRARGMAKWRAAREKREARRAARIVDRIVPADHE